MSCVTNFFKLRKAFDVVHVYLVRIYPKDSTDKIADDEKLEEHERYRIVQSGKSRADRNRKKRLMKELFGRNAFFLFDGRQHFVIGEKVETRESDQFEEGNGMVVSFEYQYAMDINEVALDIKFKEENESKEQKRVTSSAEPTRLLNLINRYRLQQAQFTKLSRRGTAWFDERGDLVFNLSLYIRFYVECRGIESVSICSCFLLNHFDDPLGLRLLLLLFINRSVSFSLY